MELFDTHCHLNLEESFPDPDTAIEEAWQAGVTRLCVVGIDLESGLRALELADRHEQVYAIVGWHPNSADDFDAEALRLVREMLTHPKAVALGEIGLDYHWDFAMKEQQLECLVQQLDLAEDLGLPVVFHCREAYGDLLDLLEARPIRPYLFHCFSGSLEVAGRALELGGILGFDGPITYKKGEETRSLLAGLGEEQFVLETDSPYLTPEPFRGKPNRPALLPYVNTAAAACRGMSVEACAAATTANARRFFGV